MAKTLIKPDTIIIDIEDYAGDTVELKVNYEDPDGVSANFDGYTVQWVFKTAPKATNALLTLTEIDGVYLNQFEANNIYGVISSAQTAALGAGSFYHFFIVTDSLGYVNTYIAGMLMLRPR